MPVVVIIAGFVVAAALSLAAQTPTPRTQLVIVVDGLRPDYVTPALMPRLYRLGQRGVVFGAHHSVFPTVTRVNSSSLVTGTYPETHGLLGNTVYVPAANPTRGLDTGSRENLELIARADGSLLTAPSLGEILQRAGKTIFASGSGTSGAVFLLNHTAAGGGVVHQDFTRPASLGPRLLERLGPVPPDAMPNGPRNARAVNAYLMLALEDVHPDLALLWISDPDHTAHNKGIGAAETTASLALVDGEIGRIEDTLRAKGVLERTNIVVVSDHGFSTHNAHLHLAALLEPFARPMPDGSKDLVVAEGAIYFRGGADAARVRDVVTMLQGHPEVGAIFTRAKTPAGVEGIVPGTLSFDLARWNHPRAGDILVSANWNGDKNEFGFPGKTTDTGVAGHGTSSPFDIHNTLIAAGPDFREHASSEVPTANVDVAPTLLRLLGLPIPASMTGRAIEEALRDGPAIASLAVEHVTDTVRSADGSYVLTAHRSKAAGKVYLDFTDVQR